MAVCHTVVPEKDQNSGELIYQAASPGTVLKTFLLAEIIIN